MKHFLTLIRCCLGSLRSRIVRGSVWCVMTLLGAALLGGDVAAGKKDALRWLDSEFTISTISRDEQVREMEWFIEAARPYRGMNVRVTSERIGTHLYEASVLAKAFSEITGINVFHETTGEDDVIKKLYTQIDINRSLYDLFISDSDLIGTHFRSQNVENLSDFIAGKGRDVTLPTLDLADFIGLEFVKGPDGALYQLPDQQFANLYWYRHDWFTREDLRRKFKQHYGYELGVPKNWSAYEDIAEFFTFVVKEIDGERVYGHMDYGRADPSLGWRFSDAWLAMAGAGDVGLPSGSPVNDWGIRTEACRPVGASVARGGALNGPAAVFSLEKYIEWLHKYAPQNAITLNFTDAGTQPGKGNIAQQIFWYTAFTAALTKPGLAVINEDGTPKWRMAPSPLGPYWKAGMKRGYQDVGAWTMLKNTPLKQQKAGWLYAQFTVSKTVSLRKTIVGLTPIRASDINSNHMTLLAPKLAGLIEFYRSPTARVQWTPTGLGVPDYPKLSTLWWKNISLAVSGQLSEKQALDKLAAEMDEGLGYIARTSSGPCAPQLNEKQKESFWLKQPGSPKPTRADEKPTGKTMSNKEMIEIWE